MFEKVRLRLTLLCAGSTAAIMIIMSLCYLFVSEQGLRRNQLQAFRNGINSLTANLEHQSVISMEWLSKMEAQGNYLFFVIDNGIPFLYNQLSDSKKSFSKTELLDEYIRTKGINQEDSDVSIQGSVSAQDNSLSYKFTSASTGINYFADTISIGEKSSLKIIVFFSLEALEKQIQDQRFRFVFIDVAAIMMLAAFSWIFTGRLLRPIIENQQKQIQFVASASHELRTPLAVILATEECCQTASPEKLEGFLKIINQETLHMSALVNDMLTLSSSDNHRLSMQMQPVELDTLIINSYEAFEPLAKKKSITLSANLPDKQLPLCLADPQRISQVISILMQNAISYTQENGEIELSLSYSKKHFYISVTDNGTGISDEDKKKIFDRFYRAEKSRSSKEHFGLGLSIAYEIVQAHNGSITVADSDSGGSRFTVILNH